MLRIAICDDEKEICIQLETILDEISSSYSFQFEVFTFTSGEALFAQIKNHNTFDLIFLDIELQRINGIKTGKLIRSIYSPVTTHIAYISGKKQYAMQLFKIQPIDFMIKPIQYNDVLHVLELTSQYIDANSKIFFEFKYKNIIQKIPCNEIIYFESSNRIIYVYTRQEKYMFYDSLSNVHKRLDKLIFISIHKSYIINYNQIKQIYYDHIVMSNSTILPISQSKRHVIRSIVMKQEGRE